MKKNMYFIILFMSIFLFNSIINAYTEYKIGDKISYNDMEFYVIKNSSSTEDIVTLLKAEPLTVDEINQYGGVGTDNNHVNMYVNEYAVGPRGITHDLNGYGGMAYYTSETCGASGFSGCTIDYGESEIKYVIDAWVDSNIQSGLKEARLITIDELKQYLGYEYYKEGTTVGYRKTNNTPSWVYDNNYWYWTMSQLMDSDSRVYSVANSDSIRVNYVDFGVGVVRPVITILKSSLGDKDENAMPNEISTDSKNEDTTNVKVANTYLKTSIIVIALGFIVACISIVIYYIIKKKGSKE